ncbi:sugar-phosphatase [Limosilactobacillus antri]|uniref:Cof family protein n=1 Tax=Limosilactobacillus antri DSM 16041 TaxID=525309 RepID=C8P4G9_9LACO|nr:sugar-phosphatase [Limosilactobacillus antri]EEW54589.1 Cof-like hydrolase [Limosilactobacillus antri DSM 16041]KRK60754.1 cof family protein [Limosilactobacillus antri DSM 16041]
MTIKMVAIDIDGTLINDQREITPKTVAAIKKASQQGVKIVLCTGRPMTGVRAYLKQLGLNNRDDEYVVSFNGGLAQTTSGKVMVDESLSFNDYADWENYCLKEGVHSQLETRDYIYTTNQDISKYTVYESELVDMPIRYRPLDEMSRIRDQYVIAKAMMVDEKEVIDRALADLPEELASRFSIVRSEDFYLEFMRKGVSKGQALDMLCQELGIGASEVMALGNAQNDNSMLEFAGHGVAMGNSVEKTLAIADDVTADNNHDGVAAAIDKYVFTD